MGRDYVEFCEQKLAHEHGAGFEVPVDRINGQLYDWQRDVVRWALVKGRAALFEDCGLGKTPQQLEWAFHVHRKTGGQVLIITPLAVAEQTVREGRKFGIDVKHVRSSDGVDLNRKIGNIYVTNYERLHHFRPEWFDGVVLDESSILKNFSGKVRQQITEFASGMRYRLACTATPAPNDYMEIGTHAEFLGVCKRNEMLSEFFVHDGGDTQKWRLKGHAEESFWQWMASWCVAIRKPSDVGYEDGAFTLPELRTHQVTVESPASEGFLFPMHAQTLTERRLARKASLENRVAAAAELAMTDNWWPCLVWCDLNAESEALARAIPDAVEIKGSDSSEHKEKAMLGFTDGSIRCLVTKPSIAGFGMNWQHCNRQVFVGLSDSYEQYYQAVRRCWRFGQQRPVDVFVVTSDAEGAVLANIQRKERAAREMFESLVQHISVYEFGAQKRRGRYAATEPMRLPAWLGREEEQEEENATAEVQRSLR